MILQVLIDLLNAAYHHRLSLVTMGLAAVVVVVPLGCFRSGARGLIRAVAGRRWLSGMLVAVVPLVTCAVLCWQRMPLPTIHDEFSYLLAADTFAHGRLTNRPHRQWEHFESFHTIQQPTYQSKYPPGQGLVLALGQVLWHPIIGAWLGVALGCVGTWWMLRGFLPASWALAGGLIIGVLPLTLSWGTNYWGGGLAMGAGSLVLGTARRYTRGIRRAGELPAEGNPRPGGAHGVAAVTGASDGASVVTVLDVATGRRIRSRVPASWGLALGAGWGTLALTRPYEGLVLSACAGVAMGAAALRRRTFLLDVRRVGFPAMLVLVPVLVWLGYYNYRVTGRPWLLPYTVHERTYAVAPVLLWEKPRPNVQFRHDVMRRFHMGWSYEPYAQRQSLSGFVRNAWGRVRFVNRVVFGQDWHALMLPLVLMPVLVWRDRRLRLAVAVALGFAAGQLLCTYLMKSYLGPVLGLLLLVYLCTVRHVWVWRFRGRPYGRWVGLGLLTLFLHSACLWVIAWKSSPVSEFAIARQGLLDQLRQRPGRFLVFVRYGSESNPHDEWVYNDADIDASKVVWAREMDAESNNRLMDCFSGRTVRLLKADAWWDGRVRTGQLWDYTPATGPSP